MPAIGDSVHTMPALAQGSTVAGLTCFLLYAVSLLPPSATHDIPQIRWINVAHVHMAKGKMADPSTHPPVRQLVSGMCRGREMLLAPSEQRVLNPRARIPGTLGGPVGGPIPPAHPIAESRPITEVHSGNAVPAGPRRNAPREGMEKLQERLTNVEAACSSLTTRIAELGRPNDDVSQRVDALERGFSELQLAIQQLEANMASALSAYASGATTGMVYQGDPVDDREDLTGSHTDY